MGALMHPRTLRCIRAKTSSKTPRSTFLAVTGELTDSGRHLLQDLFEDWVSTIFELTELSSAVGLIVERCHHFLPPSGAGGRRQAKGGL
ncbi:MAG: hypothetical protein QOG21_1529 [Actinomycetota bacterium]|jgi:hypothetical protein|nr:hypothetical protein [Actinomycetota bacterium]